MKQITLHILRWNKDHAWTDWSGHLVTDLAYRLQSACPSMKQTERKRLARLISKGGCLSIRIENPSSAESLTHILEATGASVSMTEDEVMDDPKSLKKQPPPPAQNSKRSMGSDVRAHAYHGNFPEIKHLLDEGADPNVLDEYGRSALTLASGQGHERIVELLLANGAWADPHEDYDTYETPLKRAAEEGHLGIVKLLIASGANHLAHTGVSQRTAENYAKDNGHAEVAEYLRSLPQRPITNQ